MPNKNLIPNNVPRPTKRTYGSAEAKKLYDANKRITANAFPHFMHTTNLVASDAALLWGGISDTRKDKIASLP